MSKHKSHKDSTNMPNNFNLSTLISLITLLNKIDLDKLSTVLSSIQNLNPNAEEKVEDKPEETS